MAARVDASLTLPTVPQELQARFRSGSAVAWSEPLIISSYLPAEPSDYPMYLDHRVYQGSSGRVYPLPFIERIASAPEQHRWEAIHLENRYLRLVVLPELGGRIHIGYDKTSGYDFFYRNNVIKPALVGLTGPWVSGGVEFNWPQHHRPATFLPVETEIELGDDGSVTVWCSDHDPFARMKGMHGVRLHPDRSVVEVVVRLHNRTSERQTFLWWANAAVRVHDDYQSFFPQDVGYVADHARRAITAFPAADRPYYGVDYPERARVEPGSDRIDFYRNIPVPTSYMVVDSAGEFFGGYDHAADAGFVHWADRRISPGKKQWTWGDAPFGHGWDAHLTDGDGPYVELMAGVFTDNQPDFSWLMPGETKTFSQFWYPISGIGIAHQATPDAAVHVETSDRVEAAFAVTRPMAQVTLRIRLECGRVLDERTQLLEPGVPARIAAALDPGDDRQALRAELVDADGELVVGWRPAKRQLAEPDVATEPPAPEDIHGVDELYLTGLHLAQYRHPTRSPVPYWREAIRRDPGDSRTRLALADHDYRAGDYRAALEHARIAVARATARNGNPQNAECFYALGLILRRLGDSTGAARAFAKAAWDGAWADAAGYEGALLGLAAGDTAAVLADLELRDAVGGFDARRRALHIIVLRRLGRGSEARALVRAALSDDPLDTTVRYLDGGVVPRDAATMIDLGLDLERAGEHSDALCLLERAASVLPTAAGNVAPVAHYLSAAILDRLGRAQEAAVERTRGRTADRRRAFPAGLDAHDALVAARVADPDDAVATALLATLLYDRGRRREALDLWERAIALGLDEPVTHRNAGLAAYNVDGDGERAWGHYERARHLDPADARLLFETDQLAQRLGRTAADRLGRIEEAGAAVLGERDDLVIAYSDLLVDCGRAEEAVALLESRSFQPWEGGEGIVLSAWDRARDAAGLSRVDPPASLGEGRPAAVAPAARRADGVTDYFATSLPELLLFARKSDD